MNFSLPKRIKYRILISSLWAVPVIIILLESALFLRRVGWNGPNITYNITLWSTRIVLTLLIVYYTFRFWVDHNHILRLVLIHLLGFIIYGLLHAGISLLLLKNLLSNQVTDPFGLAGKSNSDIFQILIDNTVSVNIVVYMSTVIICYAQEYVRRKIIADQRALELEKLLVVSRLEQLKSQLNTHFLFNTLHTISSLVVRGQNTAANDMLIKLSDLLRFSLKENNDQLIVLKKELEILRLYLDIQNTRFKERIDIHIDCPDSLENALIPPLLLQPIVENAIKHGIEPFPDKGVLEINISSSKNKLCIRVKDNGKKPFNEINFNDGIGNSNSKERLQKLFPGQYLFSFHPNPLHDGTTVNIKIPLLYNHEPVIENINCR